MNIILFERDELVSGRLTLRDHRARHIVKVLRSSPVDSLRVGEINGRRGRAAILSMVKKYPFMVELRVDLTTEADAPPVIDLLLALPRPIMLRRILSQVTALGVGAIHLINANRVEKSFWEAGITDEAEYRPHLIQGLEQAVDTRLPAVYLHRRFRPFVEDTLPELLHGYESFVVAHPESASSLKECLANRKGRVLYGIGPEGGWVDFEVERFMEAGMKDFSMGPRILKVDTATVAIHGRISQLLEEL